MQKILAMNIFMKKTFKNIVNTHLNEFLRDVKVPTLIIFGRDDRTTPLYMARYLHKKIKKSELVLIDKAGHFCFDDNRYLFIKNVKRFIEEG